jgi:hypothetical protein
MKSLSILGVFALVSAYPQAPPSAPKPDQPTGLSGLAALTGASGFQATLDFKNTVANDLTDGPCKAVLLIVARGSMEAGNVVRTGSVVEIELTD